LYSLSATVTVCDCLLTLVPATPLVVLAAPDFIPPQAATSNTNNGRATSNPTAP
jgi:hypothetical protein